jgi:hypothetical protein
MIIIIERSFLDTAVSPLRPASPPGCWPVAPGADMAYTVLTVDESALTFGIDLAGPAATDGRMPDRMGIRRAWCGAAEAEFELSVGGQQSYWWLLSAE